MPARKVKIIAGLQLAAATLTVVIGVVVMIPRFGRWGVAFTGMAAALALYWLVVLGRKRR